MTVFGRKGLVTEGAASARPSLAPAAPRSINAASAAPPLPEHPAEASDFAHREPRSHRLIKVRIVHDHHGRQDGFIRNLSASGIGGKTSMPLRAGDRIAIDRAELGRFEVEVRWVRAGCFGARLIGESALDRQAIERLQFDMERWKEPRCAGEADFVLFEPQRVSTWRPGLRTLPRR